MKRSGIQPNESRRSGDTDRKTWVDLNQSLSRKGGSPMTGQLATAILVLALLFFASSVFVPFFFSLFLIALAWPVQAALQRMMPKLVALLVTLALTVLVIVTVGSTVIWGFGRLGQMALPECRALPGDLFRLDRLAGRARHRHCRPDSGPLQRDLAGRSDPERRIADEQHDRLCRSRFHLRDARPARSRGFQCAAANAACAAARREDPAGQQGDRRQVAPLHAGAQRRQRLDRAWWFGYSPSWPDSNLLRPGARSPSR